MFIGIIEIPSDWGNVETQWLLADTEEEIRDEMLTILHNVFDGHEIADPDRYFPYMSIFKVEKEISVDGEIWPEFLNSLKDK